MEDKILTKKNVKYALIVLACLLALFLIYRTLKNFSDSTTSAIGKVQNANADLEIQKSEDEYLKEKEAEMREQEAEKNRIISQLTIADGYTTIEEYRASLGEGFRKRYDALYQKYVTVMGVDPGLVDKAYLEQWNEEYSLWNARAATYASLSGEAVSYLDPEWHDVNKLNAAIAVLEAEKQKQYDQNQLNWIRRYAQFTQDWEYEGVTAKGVDVFSLALLRKYLQLYVDLDALQLTMTNLFRQWSIRYTSLSATYNEVFDYFYGGYIHWKNSNHNFVRGANDLPEGTYNALKSLNQNECACISYMIKRDGGCAIYSEVNSFNKPKNKVTYTNLHDCALAVGAFQCAYENTTNVVWAVASLGVSAIVQEKNKIRSYMPDRLNNCMATIEASYDKTWTKFGFVAEDAESWLADYSQSLYGYSDTDKADIRAGRKSIYDIVRNAELPSTSMIPIE